MWKNNLITERVCRNCTENYVIDNPNQRNCTKCIDKYGKSSLTWLWKRYKTTGVKIEKLLAKQFGCCAICDKDIMLFMKTETELQACVDHCHETNEIRGILCRQCNRALGQLGDNRESILRVLEYLEETK